MSILIKNATILTMDAQHSVVNNGTVFIKDRFIQSVGTQCVSEAADRVIDAQGGLVMPGLVNAHTHLAMTLFRSFASDLPLQQWLEKIWEVEDRLTDEAVYYATALACIEALEGGTTCVNDMYFFMDAAAGACTDTGIRAYLGRAVMDAAGSGAERLAEAEHLIDQYDGSADGRLHILVAPHAEYTCSENLLRQSTELAIKKGVRLHIHLSETDFETNDCLRRRGKTPAAYLTDIGVFDVPALAAHCVTLTQEDRAILAGKGVTAVHNPASNLKLASGIAPVPQMLQQGMNVALGTDGAGSNNNLDMFRELYLAAVLHKGNQKDASLLSANTALELATVNGAGALGYNGGSIEKGKLADLIVLYPDRLSLMPLHDAAGIAVYSGTKNDVKTNIVNGKIVVENGKCVTIEREKIVRGFQKSVHALFNQ